MSRHAAPDGDAPFRVRRARTRRHDDRHHRCHRDVGAAADAGVRRAHGARRDLETVLAMVLRQGLLLVLAGLTLGIIGAIALTRVLSTYLFATKPTDPLTIAIVVVAFPVTGTLACLGPAWRATTVDPMIALRAE